MNNSPQLIYQSNPKHSEPWQRGRKGSICDQAVRPHAPTLLNDSEPDGDKRFAIFEGRAFCAQEHQAGKWHGYPVGWKEVPSRIRRVWRESGKLQKGDEKNTGRHINDQRFLS